VSSDLPQVGHLCKFGDFEWKERWPTRAGFTVSTST